MGPSCTCRLQLTLALLQFISIFSSWMLTSWASNSIIRHEDKSLITSSFSYVQSNLFNKSTFRRYLWGFSVIMWTPRRFTENSKFIKEVYTQDKMRRGSKLRLLLSCKDMLYFWKRKHNSDASKKNLESNQEPWKIIPSLKPNQGNFDICLAQFQNYYRLIPPLCVPSLFKQKCV